VKLFLRDISLPLAEFSLQVEALTVEAVSVVFGPSGSGKTSLLDLVAGLRSASSAFIQAGEHILTDTKSGRFVPPRRRGIGYVPQDLALFPHLPVRQNLAYGLKPASEKRFAFDHIVELLELAPLLDRRIQQLSGGEGQRVALGRALLASPRLLLLDEPLAKLDMALKRKILPYLSRIRDEFRIPILYVTHDRFETLSLAGDVIVLAKGRISQQGPVQEVFRRPATLDVAGILTIETVIPGRIINTAGELLVVEVGRSQLAAIASELPPGTREVYVCIHADDVVLMKGAPSQSSPRNHLPAKIEAIHQEGPLLRVELDCGFPLTALLTHQAREEMGLAAGDAVTALVKAPSVHLIAR
jgi:molybdate transport system ATP-binding protein